MAYGQKYIIEFKTYTLKQDYKIIILEKDYTGAAAEPVMAGSPAVYKLDSAEFIRGSSLQLNFMSETDGQYINLFSSDWQKFKVQLYRIFAGVPELVFEGFILPEQYFEPYRAAPYVVSFTAVDAVAMLKNMNVSELTASGQISQLKLIFLILEKISALRKIKINVNWYSSQMTNTVTTLAQVYVNFDYYKELNLSLYDILEDILKLYNSYLSQSAGAWIIQNKTAANAFTNYLIYEFDGTNITSAGDIDINSIILDVGYNTALNFDLELFAPKKTVNIKHELAPLASLVPLSDFNRAEAWTGSPEQPAGYTTGGGYVQIEKITQLNGDTYMRVWPGSSTGKTITSNLAPEVYTLYDLPHALKITAKSDTGSTPTAFDIAIFYKSGANIYYYDFAAAAWVYTTYHKTTINLPAGYEFTEITLNTSDEPPFMTGGHYGIIIEVPAIYFMHIKKIEFAPITLPAEINSTVQIVSTAINKAPDVGVLFSDIKVINYSMLPQYYKNTLKDSAGGFLSDWDGAGGSILEKLGADLVEYYTPIKKQLRGSAILDDPAAEFITFDSINYEIIEREHELVYDRAALTLLTSVNI